MGSSKNNIYKIVANIIVLVPLIYACQRQPSLFLVAPANPWKYADLRALELPENPQESPCLLALYSRQEGENYQIRLDLMNYTTDVNFDLVLAVDSLPGGHKQLPGGETGSIDWDYLIYLHFNGVNQIITSADHPVRGVKLRVSRDAIQDTVVISFNPNPLSLIPVSTQVEVFLTPVDSVSDWKADRIGPVSLGAPPPPPIPVALIFWDTFQASTPAQALRSWDGAHTGPKSSRHGLRNLLDAVELTRIPVMLLDLKTPTNLSALDYLSALPMIRRLVENELVILPDTLPVAMPEQAVFSPPEWIYASALATSRQVGSDFSLPNSPILYYPGSHFWIPSGYELILTPEKLAYAEASGVDIGADLAVLLARSLSFSPGITVLGGSLSGADWGNPQAVSQAFTYIAAHPWIKIVSGDIQALSPLNTVENADVQAPPLQPYFPFTDTQTGVASQFSVSEINNHVVNELRLSPQNRITQAAWQMYFSLLSPAAQELHILRANYLGQIGHLLTAARWAENPYPLRSCNVDVDWDGIPECVMATSKVFTSYENASLVTLFVLAADGPHQLMAPTYQFSVGISDPMQWKLEDGLFADPDQVVTGLASLFGFWDGSFLFGGFVLGFESADMAMRITYQIAPDKIFLQSHIPGNHSLSISFALDPWTRFQPGWKEHNQMQRAGQDWTWCLGEYGGIALSSPADFSVNAFTSSSPFLSQPEEPNFDYSAGHYLLFPTALARLNGKDVIEAVISFSSCTLKKDAFTLLSP